MKFIDWIKLKEENIINNSMKSNTDMELKKVLTTNMDKGPDAQKKALKQLAAKKTDPKDIAKISNVSQELNK